MVSNDFTTSSTGTNVNVIHFIHIKKYETTKCINNSLKNMVHNFDLQRFPYNHVVGTVYNILYCMCKMLPKASEYIYIYIYMYKTKKFYGIF